MDIVTASGAAHPADRVPASANAGVAAAVAQSSDASASFHLLVNPGSGANDAQRTRESIMAVFQEAGRRCESVSLDKPSQVDAACDAAARAAAASGGILVAAGGDGTLNAAARAAWTHGCPLGAIPQGTFNYFGRLHGLPQDAKAAAIALLHATSQPVQVGQVNGRLFLVNASLGLYPQLLQDREAFKAQFGRHRWVAMLSALKTLFEWRHQLQLEIETDDGERLRLRTPTLFVGNNRLQFERLGLPVDVVEQVGEGRLVAIVLKPVGTAALLRLLVRGALGRLGEADELHSFAFRSLVVRPRRTRPVKVAADGEVGRLSPPLRFAVAPRPLLLMLPRPEDRVQPQ